MVDLGQYRSHPDKPLLEHIRSVVAGVSRRTSLYIAELAAIFHDIGKLNPNFQKKLDTSQVSGYSNHAYLSAFSFLSYCAANQQSVLETINNEREWLGSILAIVSHHHGDLPDFPLILNEDEYLRLLSFLDDMPDLPISQLLEEFIHHNKFSVLNHQFKNDFQSRIQGQFTRQITRPLDFFLETQFAFASLISADKSDASRYNGNSDRIHEFCSEYNNRLNAYLENFHPNSELNKIRSEMRIEAAGEISEQLSKGKRVFALTAPTGSGKTMMLLSLAGEIVRHQGNLRIIYALPYLSITEQVDAICRKIFDGMDNHIARIDSKTENSRFEQLQAKLDEEPGKLKEIIDLQFASDTFDYPFIITTFVRLFETLVSNKNATLLKLPNFSNTIFLIDEIQSLPPRLYGFFVALLDASCTKFNSYAVVSTATMPNFTLPENNKHNLSEFFKEYASPPEMLSFEYFNKDVFNRYRIERLTAKIDIEELADKIKSETDSVLVILNTIQDTKDLFNTLLSRPVNAEVILLNTHFTPNDRKTKIEEYSRLRNECIRVILVSTQLIEAGVDIDFPTVYRDLAPLSNIVQSAGRCNRNGKMPEKGRVVVFDLYKKEISRSSLIYKGTDSRFLKFAMENIPNSLPEPELFKLQQSYFNDIQNKTLFGFHYGKQFIGGEIDFVQRIKEVAFEEIGRFKLIDESEFGEEYRYYIPQGSDDTLFEGLEKLYGELKIIDFKDFEQRKLKFVQIENQLKKMAGNIVQVRLRQNDVKPTASSEECFGLYKLSRDNYDSKTGISLTVENQFL